MGTDAWWKMVVSTDALVTFQALPVAPGVNPCVGQRQQIVRAIFRLYLPAVDQSDAHCLVPEVLMCQSQEVLLQGAQIFPLSRSMPPSRSSLCRLELLDPDSFTELEAKPIS
jgi:hypothetical protein